MMNCCWVWHLDLIWPETRYGYPTISTQQTNCSHLHICVVYIFECACRGDAHMWRQDMGNGCLPPWSSALFPWNSFSLSLDLVSGRTHRLASSSTRVKDICGYARLITWLLGSELRSSWLNQVFLPNKNFLRPLFLAFHFTVHLIHETWTYKHRQESSLCLPCHL